MFYFNLTIWLIIVGIIIFKFIRSIRIVPQRMEYIVERLGKYHKTLRPGFHTLIPFFDNVTYIQDLKEETINVPPQECFTKDNVKVEVDGVLYISVMNAERASYGITSYHNGAVQLAQTTVRSVIGTLQLDTTFEERDLINIRILEVLAKTSEHWGIKVHRYEVKNIVPPESVKKAMEQQMSAERERRAMISKAEGEKGSRISQSEGLKAELVNTSEGEMQRRINEAQGRAQEIESLTTATAEALEKIAAAVSLAGGAEAVQLQLTEQYLDTIGYIGRPETSVLLPADLTHLNRMLASVGLFTDAQALKK